MAVLFDWISLVHVRTTVTLHKVADVAAEADSMIVEVVAADEVAVEVSVIGAVEVDVVADEVEVPIVVVSVISKDKRRPSNRPDSGDPTVSTASGLPRNPTAFLLGSKHV